MPLNAGSRLFHCDVTAARAASHDDGSPPLHHATTAAGLSIGAVVTSGAVLGEYIARRVLQVEDDPDLAKNFRLKDEEFDTVDAA